jgi:hypothetical protein
MINKNKKENSIIQDSLNDCIESIVINGESAESCLNRFPQHSEELQPLVDTIKAIRSTSNVSPDPAFRARARYDFYRAMNDQFTQPATPALSWSWRWATVISSIGVFLLTSVGGTAAASLNSMPGQPLYQLKRNIENVQLAMATSKAAEARYYAAIADRRVSEIVYAAQLGDAVLTQELTAEFAESLSMFSAIAVPSRTLNFGGDDTKSGMFSSDNPPPKQYPNAATTTVTSSGTAIFETAPQMTIVQAPDSTPVLDAPQTAITLSGIDDPALLKLLQQYSAKNMAELLALLDEVDPSVRDSLIAAIETAASGYSQILGE